MALLRDAVRAHRSRRLLLAALLGSLAHASPARADADAPTVAEKAKARKYLERGQKLSREGKPDQALAAFRESHEAVADPKASLLIARSLRDMGELLKAREAYRAALDEAEALEARGQGRRATLDEIRQDLRELDGVLGFVTIELVHPPTGVHVTIDGRDVTGQLGGPIRVEPGPMVVAAGAPGSAEKSQRVTVKAGETASVELSFASWGSDSDAALADEPAASDGRAEEAGSPSEGKPSSGGRKTLAWVAGGVGAAGVVTFGVFGALSNAKFSDLEDSCPEQHCAPGLEDEQSAGKRFQTIANIGLVVGAVGFGTAITLFALGGPSDAAYSARGSGPRVALGVGSVTLSGSFE